MYSTLRPCRECSKQMLQAGIDAVYYEKDALPKDESQRAAYLRLQEGFLGGVHQLPKHTTEVPAQDLVVAVTTTTVN